MQGSIQQPICFIDTYVQVYSPWQRQWLSKLNEHLDWIKEEPNPAANHSSVRSGKFAELFDCHIPEYVEGFRCEDSDKMKEYWPAGNKAALQVCDC